MFNILIDTSVWLDLAEDQNQTPLLSVVEDLIKDGLINQKLPHADLAASFSRIKSMHFINLAECLRRIDPMRVTHFMWEQEWSTATKDVKLRNTSRKI